MAQSHPESSGGRLDPFWLEGTRLTTLGTYEIELARDLDFSEFGEEMPERRLPVRKRVRPRPVAEPEPEAVAADLERPQSQHFRTPLLIGGLVILASGVGGALALHRGNAAPPADSCAEATASQDLPPVGYRGPAPNYTQDLSNEAIPSCAPTALGGEPTTYLAQTDTGATIPITVYRHPA